MNSKAALKSSPRTLRSPEREALAENIERYNALVQQRAANEAAQTALRETIREARRAVAGSASVIEAAKAASVRHLTEKALGTAGQAPQSVKDARAAAQDAQDAFDTANEALVALEALHKATTSNMGWLTLDDCARDVIRAEAKVDAILKSPILRRIANLPTGDANSNSSPICARSRNPQASGVMSRPRPELARSPAVARRAVEALKTDPDRAVANARWAPGVAGMKLGVGEPPCPATQGCRGPHGRNNA